MRSQPPAARAKKTVEAWFFIPCITAGEKVIGWMGIIWCPGETLTRCKSYRPEESLSCKQMWCVLASVLFAMAHNATRSAVTSTEVYFSSASIHCVFTRSRSQVIFTSLNPLRIGCLGKHSKSDKEMRAVHECGFGQDTWKNKIIRALLERWNLEPSSMH